MTLITRDNIGTLFGNEFNEAEGWGVFLVQDERGRHRLEVQKLDERETFPSDVSARAWLWEQVQAGSARHRDVLNKLRAVSGTAYQQIVGDSLFAKAS